MARMPEEAPTIERNGEDIVTRHPAFGQIAVSRVSGRRTLYGSDFVHNGFVRVSIYGSEQHRTNSHDWPHHSNRPLIEVDMSEAQWGAFVSSFSSSEGARCTLVSVVGERKPEIPYEDRDAIHKIESDEAAANRWDKFSDTAGIVWLADAINRLTQQPDGPEDPQEPCDCNIGDCKRYTRRCLEDRP